MQKKTMNTQHTDADRNDETEDTGGRKFPLNVCGQYVFSRYRKAPPYFLYILFQTLSATIWMACFIATVRFSEWGWFEVLGIGAIRVREHTLPWVVFVIGLLFCLISTHMGLAEQYWTAKDRGAAAFFGFRSGFTSNKER